ncbi:hypothetical protein Maq22A_c05840 [Methylobacterium aquaticum]|uniref:Uncharacterized protein n=1 Tax=Methylobacterium aquaticum TaxID=270351 RepID=A0A0C6FHG8_9HYPH|nr:hypothetical protein Maq22A_c05840 [Methylobacterium aquaticum]
MQRDRERGRQGGEGDTHILVGHERIPFRRGAGCRAILPGCEPLRGEGPGYDGGRDRDRTCDPYDVNVVLSR